MANILILKENCNSFENYYLSNLNNGYVDSFFYYSDSSFFRKIFTHYGLIGESFWYAEWKKELRKYQLIIVFDSLHTSRLLKFIHANYDGRLIYWHWNPIRTASEVKILLETKKWCEHWTFNSVDALKYNIRLNNQFYFFQHNETIAKSDSAFFVGADKGRYRQLLSLADILRENKIHPDFHVVDQKQEGIFYQKEYMEYEDVLQHLKTSKLAVEIIQPGQCGLTVRALEAMFFKTKLITNNSEIKKCAFYKENNIFVIGDKKESLIAFLASPFIEIEREALYPYSAEGWLGKFTGEC